MEPVTQVTLDERDVEEAEEEAVIAMAEAVRRLKEAMRLRELVAARRTAQIRRAEVRVE